MRIAKSILTICFFFILSSIVTSSERQFQLIRQFNAPEARQGIAVDSACVYVIGTQEIGKYNKQTGERICNWQGDPAGPIIHLDSGVIVNRKLYCAHSNYPGIPMTSSVEIWDAETLEHIGSHSFGIQLGSCTWIDRFNNTWWGCFAHYEKFREQIGKGNEYTTIVKFDDDWQIIQMWTFPDTVLQRFRPMSNSGGSWGPDSLLYCSGHDLPELYAMRLPSAGSMLELVEIVPIDNLGQGIAWDRSAARFIYTIKKREQTVQTHHFQQF
ncbi:hypothetical protein JW960_14450 [candidate division KSB1 bacterium]|nr:hypothetical protein [candidate division KSB1 bacterium]